MCIAELQQMNRMLIDSIITSDPVILTSCSRIIEINAMNIAESLIISGTNKSSSNIPTYCIPDLHKIRPMCRLWTLHWLFVILWDGGLGNQIIIIICSSPFWPFCSNICGPNRPLNNGKFWDKSCITYCILSLHMVESGFFWWNTQECSFRTYYLYPPWDPVWGKGGLKI